RKAAEYSASELQPDAKAADRADVVNALPPLAMSARQRILDAEADAAATGHTLKPPFFYTIPLAGAPQQINSALAIATIHHLQHHGWDITTEDIRYGLAHVKWPGRLQWVHFNGHRVLMDGAHNEASAIALRHYVDTLAPSGDTAHPIHWIMGMLSDKEHEAIFKALLRSGDRLSLVPIPGHPFHPPEELAHLAQKCCPTVQSCTVHDNVFSALDLEGGVKTPDASGTIVLCGSLYLLGHVFGTLQSPKNLEGLP
ncbi:MAG: hypothetical protein F6K09_25110, partial [Merismopedia sp. SIO2A8]|nr:hypothetical protein [Merismopedia sp. SIO2A8]